MKRTKIIISAMVIIMNLTWLMGCFENTPTIPNDKNTSDLTDDLPPSEDKGEPANKFNAVIFYEEGKYIKEDFQKEHNIQKGEILDKIATVIDSEEKYNEVFSVDSKQYDVDFDKQKLIVYTFMNFYRNHERAVLSTKVEDDVLKIEYETLHKIPDSGCSCQVYQCWFVIRLDNVTAKNITVFESK